LNARDENSAALSNQIDCIRFLGKLAFNIMTCAIILAKAWFHVDNKHTCYHLVDASINTMKYLNDSLIGCIGPHMSTYILSRNFIGSVFILRDEGLRINFPVAQVVHIKSKVLKILFNLRPVQLPMISLIILIPGCPSLPCQI
jgi:hypothetical protein